MIIISAPFEEIPEYLAAANVAVVPRVCETAGGIPTKLLNYMAAAKAIVCHQSSAAFLNHLESAWLVPTGAPREFAEGILAIIRDPALANHLGEQALQLADTTYSWQSIARRVEEVYLKVLGLREQKADLKHTPVGESNVFVGGDVTSVQPLTGETRT